MYVTILLDVQQIHARLYCVLRIVLNLLIFCLFKHSRTKSFRDQCFVLHSQLYMYVSVILVGDDRITTSPSLSQGYILSSASSSFDDPHLSTWVGSLGLSLADKDQIAAGKCLTASHIAAANMILKETFPMQNGLQDTHRLFDQHKWESDPDSFVQIVYVDTISHWACLSNKFSPDGTVDLYDSMHTTPTTDGCIVKQACKILQCIQPSITINVINVQPQVGGTDCGLFAIAMAFDLCNSIDPITFTYCQDQMREHLQVCFEQKILTHLPSVVRGKVKQRSVMSVTVELFCLCRQPEHLPMACCDLCEEWFHPGCVAIPADVFNVDNVTWICPSCIHICKLSINLHLPLVALCISL